MPTLGSNLLRFEGNGSAPNLPGVPQVGTGPYGMANWYYDNMRDAAAYQSYLAHSFLQDCIRNAPRSMVIKSRAMRPEVA